MFRPTPYIIIIACLLFLPVSVMGQQSGRVYEFLGLPTTARITAMGGYAFPDTEPDLGMALMYPALMRPELSTHLSLNVSDYFGDINYGTVAFAGNLERLGSWSGSVKYIHYGVFQEADETGQLLGDFTAGEYSLMVGWGRRLSERLHIGSNIKSIHSFYHEYNAWGIAVDVSLAYLDPDRLLAASVVARNIGLQINKFRPGSNENLPFEVVFGASHKLANAPIRLSFVAHNLQRYDLTYASMQTVSVIQLQQREQTTGERLSEIGDQLLRHAIFGMEFVPSQNFHVRIGYNYRRRQEMKIDSRMSTVGLSWGVGLRVARFHLNYGRSNHHLAGSTNHISISTSLSDLFHRPEQISPE